ncbi:NAD-dependent epimerase/dehydratase family protein [Thermodesulfobacteriota bacterium]
MKKTLFITGVGGFIGKNLLKKLNFNLYQHVCAIGRTKTDEIINYMPRANFIFIEADIFEINLYSQYLKSAHIIIHLAALTGKAPREEYFRTNRDATRILLEHCRKDRIERFLFVSSIAAKFRNIKHYYYAQSKLEAEDSVKASMIPYTILRPTIVLGKDAPILDSFRKMIKPPIIPIFGNGLTKIQPVFVEDLADCMLQIINSGKFINENIEIGGPEEITIESFIKCIHRLTKKGPYRSVYLPVSFLATILSVLERYLFSFLPFTAGQLASFSNKGISENNPFIGSDQINLVGIDEMLARSLRLKETEDSNFEAVRKECRILVRYLIGSHVNAYTEKKYIQGHQKLNMELSDRFIDQLLMKKAIKSLFWVRLADIYSSIFYPQAAIRKKILLLIAILECQSFSYAQLDSVDEKSAFRLFLKLAKKGITSLIMLALSMILIGPFHAVSKLGENK